MNVCSLLSNSTLLFWYFNFYDIHDCYVNFRGFLLKIKEIVKCNCYQGLLKLKDRVGDECGLLDH